MYKGYKAKSVDDIIGESEKLRPFSLDELVERGRELSKLAETKPLDNLLVDAYALVCEVARRVVRERPRMRAVQIEAAIALHDGKIVEMQNGEGKTLVVTMPAYLNSLKKQHVHIATYNNYLAHRDALWMGPVYATLDLTVGVIEEKTQYQLRRNEHDDVQEANANYELIPCDRQSAYACDIVYGGTPADFALDYLKDNHVENSANIIQDGHLDYIILDEADSVLIEKAHGLLHNQNPDLLNWLFSRRRGWYYAVFDVAKQLQKSQDFVIDFSQKVVELTPSGIAHVEALLHEAKLRNAPLLGENTPLYGEEASGTAEQILQSLYAIYLCDKDQAYIVEKKDNSDDYCIKLLDIHTGRPDSRLQFSRGLQQALEVKESIDSLSPTSQVIGRISYQHFLKLYKKMAGMTATAREHRAELFAHYQKRVVEISPFASSQRTDKSDLIYRTKIGRLNAAHPSIWGTLPACCLVLMMNDILLKKMEASRSFSGVR